MRRPDRSTGAKNSDTPRLRVAPQTHAWIQSCAFELFDPNDLATVVPQTHVEHSLVSPGRFKGAAVQADLGGSRFATAAYSLPLFGRGPMPLSIAVFLDGEGSVRVSGQEMLPGDIVVFGEAAELICRMPPRMQWAILELKPDDLDSLGISIESHTVAAHRLSAGARYQLKRAVLDATETVKETETGRDGIASAKAARSALDANLLTAFASAVGNTKHVSTPEGATRTSVQRSALVARADDYIRQNLDHPLRMTDLCSHLGTTLRQLELAFQQVCGISPKRYELIRRISAFRGRLLSASPNSASVTQIALECGFFHLGRLSTTYRRMFGESPNTTLARRLPSGLR